MPDPKQYANEDDMPAYVRSRRKKHQENPELGIYADRSANLEKKYNFTSEQVCKLIREERGMLTYVAQRLDIQRDVLRKYVVDRVDCAAALSEARESMGDVAERKLHQLIEAGDVRCIIYYLSTVHRHRGYGLKKDEADVSEHKNVVNTINIVAVPSGKFLSKEEIDGLTIEGTPVRLPSPSLPPVPSCMQ